MYGNIVPMDLQDELIAIRDSNTRNAWRIADITAEVIENHILNHSTVALQDIYSAVGMFVGKASRTVREYHMIGRFFDPELREHFSVLAFDHFRHAACLGADQAIYALQWAVEQADTLGRPATVDAMIAKFSPPMPGEPEIPPDQEEGPGGIYSTIYRNVITQAMAAQNWLEGELPERVRAALHSYWMAAQVVISVIPAGEALVIH